MTSHNGKHWYEKRSISKSIEFAYRHQAVDLTEALERRQKVDRLHLRIVDEQVMRMNMAREREIEAWLISGCFMNELLQVFGDDGSWWLETQSSVSDFP